MQIWVAWFDELKGIREGLTEKGETVFFKAEQIQKDGFLTTKRGEIIIICK